MTESKLPLPSFSAPPIGEVAISVQFDPLTSLRASHIGLIWNAFRNQFPKTEEHSPLGMAIEKFGSPEFNLPNIEVEMLTAPTMPRIWFLNNDGTQLIQIQQDRFIHNWRKIGQNEYPRYNKVIKEFVKEFDEFQAILRKEKIGEIIPNQCEVTYVNHIVSGAGWKNYSDLSQVFTLFDSRYSEPTIFKFEDAHIASRFIIPNPEAPSGLPLGRLHLSIVPGVRREDNQPIFAMSLTARGKPVGAGIEGVLKFMEIGHECIVRGFASLTTPSMHKIWGRSDV